MKKTVALLAGVVWLLLAQAGAAFAATSGPQTWVVVSRSGEPTRVGAYGIINSAGTVTDRLSLHLENGTFDNFATQTFPDGTVEYHGSGTAVLTVDPATSGGTGRYVKATGSGVAIGDLGFLFARTDQGCSQAPVQFWGVARATGQLTL